MNILVFRTNISNTDLVRRAGLHMGGLEGVVRWNVDLHDVDCVLRVESTGVGAREVETVLQGAGYLCEELGD